MSEKTTRPLALTSYTHLQFSLLSEYGWSPIVITRCTTVQFLSPSKYRKYVSSSLIYSPCLPCPFQPADPRWESLVIQNPHLESHLDRPDLLPGIALPDRRYITSYDPATGLHLGTFMADNEAEIEKKIKLAGKAQKTWKNTTFTHRKRVVRSLMKWLVENQELCAKVACRDSGKTRKFSTMSSCTY